MSNQIESKKYDGPERRKVLRVSYKPDERPMLKVGENEFEVADISVWGLRFFNATNIEVQPRVRGTITLLCGQSIDVDGMIVREKRVDIYIQSKIPISENILIREQRLISHNCD